MKWVLSFAEQQDGQKSHIEILKKGTTFLNRVERLAFGIM